MPIGTSDILSDPNFSGVLSLVGAVAVYVFREIYKDFKYNKIRANERELAQQQRPVCNFDDSQRERIYSIGTAARSREELIKDVIQDQAKIIKLVDRLSDKVDQISDDLDRDRKS